MNISSRLVDLAIKLALGVQRANTLGLISWTLTVHAYSIELFIGPTTWIISFVKTGHSNHAYNSCIIDVMSQESQDELAYGKKLSETFCIYMAILNKIYVNYENMTNKFELCTDITMEVYK